MDYIIINGELYHHGIEGQKWGVRRFQNKDGTLTDEGKERYSGSLTSTYGDDDDYDQDYHISKGSSVSRRTSQHKEDNGFDGAKYTYTYDQDNQRDDDFYKQFGTRVSEYTTVDDIKLAGRTTLGKAFVEKMLTLTDESDIDAMDTYYYDSRSKLGEDYVEDLFTLPYQPEKHLEALEKAGSTMIGSILAAQRNDALDAKMRKKGFRDDATAANDIGLDILERLKADGYSGMRDYNDLDSNAMVKTPTVIFDPEEKLRLLNTWYDK